MPPSGSWLRRFSGRTGGPGNRPRRTYRPALEELEDRLVPTTCTWTGADNNHWIDPGNWSQLPVNGDDLVFPANAQGIDSTTATFNLVDDLASLTKVNSIKFTNTAGPTLRVYNITGTLPLTVDAGGIADTDPNPGTSQNGGRDIIGLNLTLSSDQTWTPGNREIDIKGTVNTNGFTLTVGASGFNGSMVFFKQISGTGSVKVDGPTFTDFVSADSYTGSTTVSNGAHLSIDADGGLPGDVTVHSSDLRLSNSVTSYTKPITITLNAGTLEGIAVFPGNINVTAAAGNAFADGDQISGLDCTGDVTYGNFAEKLGITVDGTLTGGGSLSAI